MKRYWRKLQHWLGLLVSTEINSTYGRLVAVLTHGSVDTFWDDEEKRKVTRP